MDFYRGDWRSDIKSQENICMCTWKLSGIGTQVRGVSSMDVYETSKKVSCFTASPKVRGADKKRSGFG